MSDTDTNSDQGSGLKTDSSVAKALFFGNIINQNLFPFPKITGDEAETLQMVLESVDRFLESKREEFPKYDHAGKQPPEYIESLKELGLFGLVIPEEHGGIGLSNRSYSRAVQQTSRYDGSTSLTIGAHSSIGMRGVLLFGSEDQKERYLPKLATGELIAAFCLTEAGSGSDAASIKTSAAKNEDGSWTLNGEKIWITNGPFAEFFTVFARTEGESGKLSAFLVERAFGGVTNGPHEDKLGIRASGTSTVNFDNVKVPAENLLGEEGKGFKIAMSVLNSGRSGLGGGCVGGIKECIRLASAYAQERKQFGKSISEFAMIREKVAQMTLDCFAAESAVQMVAYYSDSGVSDYSVEAAMSKIFATEALWRAANESLQIAGGNGYMKEYPYERLVRDSRINMIFEGTSEILRLFVALSGMKDVGEYLKEIGKGASSVFNDPIKGFGVLSGYAQKKLAEYTTIGRDRVSGVAEELSEQAEMFEKHTQEFAGAVEGLLKKYKKGIIGRQLMSKRVADTSIDLFVGLCVLSRVSSMIHEKGADSCKTEIMLAKLFTQQASRRMQNNLTAVDKNEAEDDMMEKVAEYIFDNENYTWDVF